MAGGNLRSTDIYTSQKYKNERNVKSCNHKFFHEKSKGIQLSKAQGISKNCKRKFIIAKREILFDEGNIGTLKFPFSRNFPAIFILLSIFRVQLNCRLSPEFNLKIALNCFIFTFHKDSAF